MSKLAEEERCNGCAIIAPDYFTLEQTMRDLPRYIPFVLVVFIVLIMGMTDQLVGASSRVFVTLLAPILWLGLSLLFGSDRVGRKE